VFVVTNAAMLAVAILGQMIYLNNKMDDGVPATTIAETEARNL